MCEIKKKMSITVTPTIGKHYTCDLLNAKVTDRYINALHRPQRAMPVRVAQGYCTASFGLDTILVNSVPLAANRLKEAW